MTLIMFNKAWYLILVYYLPYSKVKIIFDDIPIDTFHLKISRCRSAIWRINYSVDIWQLGYHSQTFAFIYLYKHK